MAGAAPISTEINWKAFLRTVWPIALLAGICARFYPPIGFLIVVPVTVFVAIRLYAKRQPASLRAGQGAKLGMSVGFISFVAFAALTVAALATNAAARQEAIRQGTEALLRNPDPAIRPQIQHMVEVINTPLGFAMVIAVGSVVLMLFLLAFTAIAGAVAASTFGHKKP